MPFETKKINIETLSEYIHETRRGLGLNLEQVSKQSGVAVKFIELLEAGNFHALPPTVYVAGFLRQLSRIYGVSADVLIEQFKKERSLINPPAGTINASKSSVKKIFNSLVVTPKLLSVSLGLLFVGFTLLYIVIQIVGMYGAPKLIVTKPANGEKIADSAVRVIGKTDPGVSLTINNEPVLVEANSGEFHATISVADGQKELTFVATNKFKKVTSKKILVHVDSSRPETVGQFPVSTLVLVFNFTAQVTITYTVDNASPVTETVAAGSTKTIQAESRVLFSSSNAGATSVGLNGRPLGVLGKKNQPITNIPFTIDSLGGFSPNLDANHGQALIIRSLNN